MEHLPLLCSEKVSEVCEVSKCQNGASINAFLCPCCLTSASDGTQLLLLLRGQRYGGICICANVFLFFARGEPDYIRHNGKKTVPTGSALRSSYLTLFERLLLRFSETRAAHLFLRISTGHSRCAWFASRQNEKKKETRGWRLAHLTKRKTDKKLKQDRIRAHL